MTAPTVGRIVHYALTAADAEMINRRRADYDAHRRSQPRPATGHIAHVGNHAAEGDVCAATIVRTFDGHAANLQVHLDGNDTYWATSRTEGDGAGFWSWPARA